MYVYIVSIGYMYEGLKIVKVYDNLVKAKSFCETEYGIKVDDWTISETKDHYFYDPEEQYYLKTDYNDFEIAVRSVE